MRPTPSAAPTSGGVELEAAAGRDVEEVAVLLVEVGDARVDEVLHRRRDLDVAR